MCDPWYQCRASPKEIKDYLWEKEYKGFDSIFNLVLEEFDLNGTPDVSLRGVGLISVEFAERMKDKLSLRAEHKVEQSQSSRIPITSEKI